MVPKVIFVCHNWTVRSLEQFAQMLKWKKCDEETLIIHTMEGRDIEVYGVDKVEGADYGELVNVMIDKLDDVQRQTIYEQLHKLGCKIYKE